jgi:perosamine synthetase
MTEITQFALAHRLDIVEDAAEAVGASWRGRACGTIGDFGCFSFYGNKVITTGEGGAVICRSKTDYDRARLLRGQAQGKRRFYHEEVGFNYRLTDLQAAVGRAQLRRVDDFLQRRRAVCEFYRGSTGKLLEAPTQGPDGVIAPWMFTGVLPPGVKRDLVMRQLRDRGVETRPTFVPLHRLPMYRENDSEFPVACVIGDSGISLPTYPDMTAKDAENVVKLLEECIS